MLPLHLASAGGATPTDITIRPLGSQKAREWVLKSMTIEQREGDQFTSIEDRLPNMSHGMRCDVIDVRVKIQHRFHLWAHSRRVGRICTELATCTLVLSPTLDSTQLVGLHYLPVRPFVIIAFTVSLEHCGHCDLSSAS